MSPRCPRCPDPGPVSPGSSSQVKPPFVFPLPTPHYGRGRGRTGRFRLSILAKPGRPGTGTRAGGKKKSPIPLHPCPNPAQGPQAGDTPGNPHRNGGEQNQLGLAVLPAVPGRNQAARGLPGRAAGQRPGMRAMSRAPARPHRHNPATPSPQGSQRPEAPPDVSPPTCHHCCSSRVSLVPKPRTQRLQRAGSFIFLMSV